MLFDLVSALLIAGSPVAVFGGATVLAEHNPTYTTPKGTHQMPVQGDPWCNTSTEPVANAVCRWGPEDVGTSKLGYPDIKARPGKHLPSWLPWTGSTGRFTEDYFPGYSRD